MIGAFWILIFTVAVGIFLYLGELRWRKTHRDAESSDQAKPDDAGSETDDACCGLHLVCEKDSLSPMSDEILYYDDEELDRFAGRDPQSYSAEEIEEFRDVLMTLRPEDISGWARSITQRRLELPLEIKDELLMLVNEQRNNVKIN